ncbi:uncharacterized protein LOC120654156 [Panicum virgatum]|uniref:Uncharacterized protein n=1 Tax=Panicum virgatum TaxID=38727 RepID=A0A8T0X3I3_PANVG|nr:uncharacterized protein LOC120654156 [Panicum virgatum]KAG2652476.1 hypothetical protein PVAP13_1NG339200 [Panicum virgatum]
MRSLVPQPAAQPPLSRPCAAPAEFALAVLPEGARAVSSKGGAATPAGHGWSCAPTGARAAGAKGGTVQLPHERRWRSSRLSHTRRGGVARCSSTCGGGGARSSCLHAAAALAAPARTRQRCSRLLHTQRRRSSWPSLKRALVAEATSSSAVHLILRVTKSFRPSSNGAVVYREGRRAVSAAHPLQRKYGAEAGHASTGLPKWRLSRWMTRCRGR